MYRLISATILFIPCLFAGLLFGEVEHSGFVGGPFHGFGQDVSSGVFVQYGPTADLTVPNGLSAYPQTNRLPSGGSSTLNASLLLDDSTITVLDSKLVEWSVSNAALQVREGSMLAEILPERTTVRVQARAQGFSASFNIFILPQENPLNGHLPGSLRAAIELEAKGWKKSEWLGVFYDAENGWLYHADHGWIHVSEGGKGTIWFWIKQHQWVWTGENIYPHLYRNRDAAWLYFFKQALPNQIFYNYKTESLERLAGN
jgi:hypothetical protein